MSQWIRFHAKREYNTTVLVSLSLHEQSRVHLAAGATQTFRRFIKNLTGNGAMSQGKGVLCGY